MKKFLMQYGAYLIRWQLSSPILAVVLIVFADTNTWLATVLANCIGGCLFFWIDRFIFKSVSKEPIWEIHEDCTCADCGEAGTGYRIIEWLRYDKRQDKEPQYRCSACRIVKMEEVCKRIKKL